MVDSIEAHRENSAMEMITHGELPRDAAPTPEGARVCPGRALEQLELPLPSAALWLSQLPRNTGRGYSDTSVSICGKESPCAKSEPGRKPVIFCIAVKTIQQSALQSILQYLLLYCMAVL